MSTNKENSRILARTFFSQLRAAGYTPTQIIGVATELLDLVTVGLKEKAPQDVVAADSSAAPQGDWRREA